MEDKAVTNKNEATPDDTKSGSLIGNSTRRQFIGRSAGVALAVGGTSAFLAACGGGSSGSDGEVNVLSWISYVDPTVKKLWAESYPDIKLNGVAADADQNMFNKLKAGGGGSYDVVFANAGWAPTYYENGLTEIIDLSEIPASKELYDVFREDTSLPIVKEKDKLLLYPNMWASLSMTWNTQVDYQPSEPYSWSALWSPEIPENHVMLQGGGDDIIAMAGIEQGVPREKIYSMKGAELQKAVDRLIELKPFQLNPNVLPQFRQAIVTEQAWIGYTSDLSAGPLINEETGEDTAKSVVPEQGTVGWIDGPQLVKGAKNRKNAQTFIDWFASNEELQSYLWDAYRFAQCNKNSVQRVLDKGGPQAKLARDINADKPETVKQITLQRPADDPAAWAAAWDEVTGA